MEIAETTLIDQSDEFKTEVPLRIESCNGKLYIEALGYGDACSQDGHGVPIGIEIWEGELRVIVWSDINQEDPTHIISLEGAREDKRVEEKEPCLCGRGECPECGV